MNKQESQKLEKSVLEILNQHLPKNSTVIVGVSGGADSIFLLEILKKLNLKIIVAHLNHKIRKKGATKDAELVRKLSEGLTCHIQEKDTKAIAARSKKGLEEVGRIERYKFFQKLAKKYQAKHILTAHHADDNLETVIMNLARGCGLEGLSGMKISQTLQKDVLLFRPLLNVSKSSIQSYLKFHKIPYHQDSENLNKKYTRNFIRHEIIPKLQKINPNITDTVGKNSQNIRETNQYIQEEAQSWIKKNALNKTATILDAKKFRTQHKTLQKAIIRQNYLNLINNVTNIEIIHIEEVLKIINQNIGNKQKKLGKLKITIKNNAINFVLAN